MEKIWTSEKFKKNHSIASKKVWKNLTKEKRETWINNMARSLIGKHRSEETKKRLSEIHREIIRKGLPWKPKYKIGSICVRSLLESMIASKLYNYNISFVYEQPLWINGKVFFPDFTLNGYGVIIEASSMAFQKLVNFTLERAKTIRNFTGKRYVIVTYNKNIKSLCPNYKDFCDEIISVNPVKSNKQLELTNQPELDDFLSRLKAGSHNVV
jgi:hypothetical protein